MKSSIVVSLVVAVAASVSLAATRTFAQPTTAGMGCCRCNFANASSFGLPLGVLFSKYCDAGFCAAKMPFEFYTAGYCATDSSSGSCAPNCRSNTELVYTDSCKGNGTSTCLGGVICTPKIVSAAYLPQPCS
eukprot:TRINITY_DN3099_c0_g1_i2.p1 TRINITY_DN3099_c0_g1~~TRINITY_DN3099_c0_g1_i2.p1  ORF type:complete len:132 (+),score=1.55 TRINITY_DN3099_c0_g1_i2:52-447(+)